MVYQDLQREDGLQRHEDFTMVRPMHPQARASEVQVTQTVQSKSVGGQLLAQIQGPLAELERVL